MVVSTLPLASVRPIRTKRDAIDPTRMPGERPLVRSRNGIPQTDGCVITATGEGPSIRTERNASNLTCMPGEELFVFTRHGIP